MRENKYTGCLIEQKPPLNERPSIPEIDVDEWQSAQQTQENYEWKLKMWFSWESVLVGIMFSSSLTLLIMHQFLNQPIDAANSNAYQTVGYMNIALLFIVIASRTRRKQIERHN